MNTRATNKFRVGVLMGGKSVEREVSFNSGRTVCDHIDGDRYEVVPLFQSAIGALYVLPQKFLHRGKISDFESRLSTEATSIMWDDLKALVDFVYIAVHGCFAEDGTLQGMLEVLGIPYLGSKVFGSACGINKIFQKQLLSINGIPVPKGIVVSPEEIRKYSCEKIDKKIKASGFGFPYVIKPALEGSSLGISVVFSEEELLPALEKASWGDVTREQHVLIEECISGMEFTCIGLRRHENNEWMALPITEVVHEEGTFFHDYEQKYMPGRSTKITPARCSEMDREEIQKVCVGVAEALDFATFFRIDGFLTNDKKVVIIDPNSLSGMGPASFLFHQAAEIGMNHTRLINYLIECELEQYNLLNDVVLQQEEKMMVQVAGGKKRVVVLLGGPSNEREISLESGRNVCYKLSPSKYEAIPVFVDMQKRLYKLSPRLLIQNSTREIKELVTEEMEIKWNDLPKLCDFVFIALHGGEGENGSVQGALEMLGLPYNGSGVLASALCMNKHKTNKFLAEHGGFAVPKSILVGKEEWVQVVDSIEAEIGYPLILKPHDDGCSVYVQKVVSREDLCDKLQHYFKTEKNIAMLEELVEGMELTCGVLGNDEVTALPPSRAVAGAGILSIKEKFLPGAGENQTPAPLPERVLSLVKKVMKEVYTTVGCKGYCRIDCFYQDKETSRTGEERVVILEINSLPGLTPATCFFHQSAEIGMRPMEVFDTIIELGFQNHMPVCGKPLYMEKEK